MILSASLVCGIPINRDPIHFGRDTFSTLAKDIKVTVVERVGQNWTISENSHGYDKKDAYTVEFTVDVPKGGENVIKYTIEYNW